MKINTNRVKKLFNNKVIKNSNLKKINKLF